MPKEKTEVAEGLSAEELAWLDEEDAKAEETEKKIASGEIPQSVVSGWSSDNWQTKAGEQPPPDIE